MTRNNRKPWTEPAITGFYPYDPGLAENLLELKEICREIGAFDMHVIRHAAQVWISYQVGQGEDERIKELRLQDCGLLFICIFHNSDGGPPGHETDQVSLRERR